MLNVNNQEKNFNYLYFIKNSILLIDYDKLDIKSGYYLAMIIKNFIKTKILITKELLQRLEMVTTDIIKYFKSCKFESYYKLWDELNKIIDNCVFYDNIFNVYFMIKKDYDNCYYLIKDCNYLLNNIDYE